MSYTGVSVFPTDSDGTQFWTIVNWCLDRGAADFSVSTIGLNGYALGASGFRVGRLPEVGIAVER